jgi:acetyl esterase
VDRRQRATFGTDRLIIGGSSAGAHLASLVLLHARDHLQVLDRVVAANLIFGCYDIRATPSALHATPQTLLLTSDWISQFPTNAFGADASLRDPRTSPLYAKLDGLPAALFTVGALDPLLDDSLFVAARWRAAGGHSDVDVWPACAHGFIGTMPITGSRAVARISDWLAATSEQTTNADRNLPGRPANLAIAPLLRIGPGFPGKRRAQRRPSKPRRLLDCNAAAATATVKIDVCSKQ